LHGAGDRAGATGGFASVAFAVIDLEMLGKIPKFPIRLPEIAQGGAACINRLGQHFADDRDEAVDSGFREVTGKGKGADPGAEQGFANVDIAQTRDDALIQKRGFDRGAAASQTRRKVGFVEIIPKGLRPKSRQQGMRATCGHEVHRAKTAGVVEGDPGAALHVQNHMVMLLRRGVVVVELAQHRAGNQHPARHAKVNEQRLTPIQIGEDVFRPPPQRQDPRPGQPVGHSFRQGPAQIGAVHLGPFDDRAFHDRGKATADSLNLGQFRHRRFRTVRRIAGAGWGTIRRVEAEDASQMSDEKTTHFGFQDVPEADKAGMVHGVFSRVASKYDVMNDLMSGGVHRLWKDAMMDWLAPRTGQRLLDVAGGTGDVAFRFLKRAPGASAVVCDLTEPMLIEGRKRAEAEKLAPSLDWVVGDAMALPFPDASFDVYTISFGIRNVTRIPDALAEAYRVLKPGGRLMVLEFSQIPNDLLQKVYDLYSFNVIPVMGQIVAGDRDSYQYLVESIRKFPDQETFATMIRAAGFGQVKYRNLTMGVAALHSGWKL
jgi:demethylmenaquinone methyltransferase / 2-methoxy-6-polyprenyl-1,4-benzoquinol methylase